MIISPMTPVLSHLQERHRGVSISRSIAIVGAGQAGLQLGIGLLEKAFAVTLVAERSAKWGVTFNKGQYGSEW